MKGECKLCRKTRKLRQSHIIPEAAYRLLYDEKSRAIAIHSKNAKRRKIQQGLKERLLCDVCENIFNKIEKPFIEFWRDSDLFPECFGQDQVHVSIHNVNFENTRKFHLSVLWRAHIAESETLSAVNLGPHADSIRRIFCGESSALEDGAYPIYCYALRDPDTGGPARQLVLTPVKTKTKGQWNYMLMLFGCLWQIFVSGQPTPLPDTCRLKQDGSIVMPVEDYNKFPPIRNIHNGRAK